MQSSILIINKKRTPNPAPFFPESLSATLSSASRNHLSLKGFRTFFAWTFGSVEMMMRRIFGSSIGYNLRGEHALLD
jgi:hypothetical protein